MGFFLFLFLFFNPLSFFFSGMSESEQALKGTSQIKILSSEDIEGMRVVCRVRGFWFFLQSAFIFFKKIYNDFTTLSQHIWGYKLSNHFKALKNSLGGLIFSSFFSSCDSQFSVKYFVSRKMTFICFLALLLLVRQSVPETLLLFYSA